MVRHDAACQQVVIRSVVFVKLTHRKAGNLRLLEPSRASSCWFVQMAVVFLEKSPCHLKDFAVLFGFAEIWFASNFPDCLVSRLLERLQPFSWNGTFQVDGDEEGGANWLEMCQPSPVLSFHEGLGQGFYAASQNYENSAAGTIPPHIAMQNGPGSFSFIG